VLARRGDATVLDCARCGFAHLDPLPDEAELAFVYERAYYEEASPGWLEKDRSERAYWDLEHADKLGDWRRLLGRDTGVLLDVGCSGGLLLEHAAQRGWTARGIEPSGLAVAECRRLGLDGVRQGRYQDIDEVATADVVHAKLVLEHLHDPAGFVAWARRILRPGGVLTVQVPNEFTPLQRAARAALDLEAWWVAPPFHLNYFGFASLERLLRAGGLEVAGRDATFPMEAFLLMGEDYVRDPELGRDVHARRMRLERALEDAGLRRALHRHLAERGLGREAIVHARVPAAPPAQRSIARSEALWERARRVIPGGTQTLSKSPTQFVDGVSPKFLVRGKGARVWDVDGNEYVDWPMALGPILVGYDEPEISAAAVAQLRGGTTFTLMHPLEVEVAEALVEIVPCAEQVRFAKNGGDATNGAIRAARALTGREHVIATGYHGYHDWFIASTERDDGVPAHNRALVHPAPFDDLPALEAALAARRGEVAAVIMEIPAREPAPGYLQAAIDLTHRHGALFILDEIVTGFRYALGGAQERYGVLPDLACLGKGMANGYPLAAVVGSRDAMAAFDRVFFSMTYSGETVALAAALATLRFLRREPVIERIWETGRLLRAGLAERLEASPCGVRLDGNPPRSSLAFPSDASRGLFLQECHKRGVLFGVPIFPTYRHDERDVRQTLDAVDAAFARMEVAHAEGAYEPHLEGRPPGAVFRKQ